MKLHLNVGAFYRFQTARLAVLEKDMENMGDPNLSVFAAWGIYPTSSGNLLFLLDMRRGFFDSDQFMNAHEELRMKCKTARTFMYTTSFQTKVAQDMMAAGCKIDRMGDGEDAYAFVDKDPCARVLAATKFLKTRRLFVPETAPFLSTALKEWTSFPLATHADCVEVLCLACVVADRPASSKPVWYKASNTPKANQDRKAAQETTSAYYVAKPRGL